jgi:hypothetical protein
LKFWIAQAATAGTDVAISAGNMNLDGDAIRVIIELK